MKSRILTPSIVLAVVALAAAGTLPALAATDTGERVTFYRDVLPILQANCQTCHRPFGLNLGGMVAPMSFLDYQEVRPWARSIARQVESRTMPPWHASDAQSGTFENERRLNDAEIATVVKWAKTGAVAGDPGDAPPAIEWPQREWAFEPDLVVEMPEPFLVKDDVEDLYMDFPVTITEEMLPEPRWIRMSQAKGGSPVVHHIIARPIGGMAPGADYTMYPDGFGALLKPGDTVVFNMHYHKEPGPGTAVWDRSKVAVKFHDQPVTHPITTRPVGNGGFEIPPGHPDWKVGAAQVFDEDTTIIALLPHMHLRGSYAKYTAFYPDGSTEVLLEVPKYDFNWQTRYQYEVLKQIPAGTRIEFIAHYDNSAANPSNPDPSEAVRFGEPTTAEMMLGWMTYAPTRPQGKATEIPSGGGE
jgi:mono/diheme cytochrome c family protein